MRDGESVYADSAHGAFRATVAFALVAIVGFLALNVARAGAAPHPEVTGEYGKLGPVSSGVGSEGCQIAFHGQSQRLYLLADQKIYGLNRLSPGLATPAGGAFPLSAAGGCEYADIDVDNNGGSSSGNIFATSFGSRLVAGWSPSGSPLASPWPVDLSSAGAYPCGLATTSSGEVWASDYFGLTARKYSASGAFLGKLDREYRFCKLTFDPTNNDLYAIDESGVVRKHSAASGYTSTLNFPASSFNSGIAVNGALGRLYVGTSESVEVFNTTTAALEETIPLGGFGGVGLAIDEATDTVFATVGSGDTGVIKEWSGLGLPKATTGDPVGNNEATGTADPNGVGDITECYFEFGSDDSYGSTQSCADSLPIASEEPVHALLPGLTGEQTYHYRLVLGTGAPGVVRRGGDKTVTPHWIPNIETEPATDIARTTATLNSSFEGNGEDHDYYFEWGLTSDYDHQTATQEINPATGPTSAPASVTGLTAQTTYHYRVVVSNGLGTSIGPDETFTTTLAIKDLGTDPATDIGTTTATFNGSLDPDGLATTYYFQYGRSTQYGQLAPIPHAAVVDSSPGVKSVSADVQELEPGALYHYRIVASNGTGKTTATDDETFETPQAPSIDSFTTANIFADSAELIARINPHGEETTYRFEYGPTPSYGSVEPVPDGILTAASTPQTVTVQLSDLDRVGYHFRVVAESKWGTTTSPDQTFSFDPSNCPNTHLRQQTGAGYLPDCRAYELVSPSMAGGLDLAAFGPTSAYATTPPRFTFAGYFGTIEGTGDPQGVLGDLYIATRTIEGWKTRYAGIRGNEGALTSGPPTEYANNLPETIRADLTLGKILDWDNGQKGFVCCGALGSMAAFMWDSEGNFLGRLPTGVEDVPNGTTDITKGGFLGGVRPSADFSHYFFSSNNVPFTAGGLTVSPGSAYDNDLETGEITLISKTPQGTDIPQDAGSSGEYIRFPGASTDGSHVLMSTEAPGGETHLYMAVDATEFFDVSVNESEENVGVKFEGITPDGETVYFTAEQQMTADDTDTSRDLFRWEDGNPPTVTRISAGTGETGNSDACGSSWTSKCGVATVDIGSQVGFSGPKPQPTDNAIAAETAEVYFYSPELLDNGKGNLGERNLYVYREGQPRYVTTFTGGRLADRIQVSPDGEHMAFVTAEKLTPYENAGWRQMYTYEPATHSLRCVSCIPDGTPPTSNVEASEHGTFMTDDGRAFFATQDGVVPRDTNKGWDIYEFVESRPQLISSGTADEDVGRFNHAGLMGVSADGIDVYFSTLDSLVGQDRNGQFYKFYDARTNGGFNFSPPPAPCVAADECHGPSSAAPPPPTMGTSATLGDGGNAKALKKKKAKKKRHKTKRRRDKRARRGHHR